MNFNSNSTTAANKFVPAHSLFGFSDHSVRLLLLLAHTTHPT